MKNRKRARRITWATVGLLIVSGLTLAFVYGRPRTHVDMARVKRGTFERWVEEDGRARVRDRFVITTPIAGTVDRTTHRVGDTVGKDEVVAVLQPLPGPMIDVRSRAELDQRRGAAEAALLSARTGVERADLASTHADSELSRIQNLVKSGSLPQRELDLAELAARVAARERDQAKQAVHLAEHNLEMARAALGASTRSRSEEFDIRSPEAGRILKIFQENEGAVAIGAPLLELGDPDVLEVAVDLLSTDAILVNAGAEAQLTHWASSEIMPARVRLVEPVAITKVSALGVEEQRVNVIIDPVGDSPEWKRVGDGYRVDGRILVERMENAVLVPTSALFREQGAWTVFRVQDGRARKRLVRLRAYGSVESAVEEGLDENETVVVQAPKDMADGMRVEPN